MRNSIGIIALLMAVAAPLAAQGAGAPMGAGQAPAGPIPPAARFMLAHTGELNLTDAQVVKLAAIERRAEARRSATRASMDSMRTRMMAQPVPTDSAARLARRNTMMSTMQATRTRMQEQQQADLRDAIAVLTPDQQAKAWQIVAQSPRGNRAARPGRAMRPGAMGQMAPGGARPRMRPGMGMGRGQGMGMGQNPPNRPPQAGMGQRPPV